MDVEKSNIPKTWVMGDNVRYDRCRFYGHFTLLSNKTVVHDERHHAERAA